MRGEGGDTGASATHGQPMRGERLKGERTAEMVREEGRAADRERLRRILIYRHMRETTGEIQWGLVAGWMYQPTEREVNDLADEIEGRQHMYTRPKVAVGVA